MQLVFDLCKCYSEKSKRVSFCSNCKQIIVFESVVVFRDCKRHQQEHLFDGFYHLCHSCKIKGWRSISKSTQGKSENYLYNQFTQEKETVTLNKTISRL